MIFAAILVITNLGFTVGYDTDAASPSWVAYDLEPHEVVKASRPSLSFRSDDRLDGADRLAANIPTGYDRGHMAPAADFLWSTNALRQTYLYSNVCPMKAKVNRGRWRQGEDEVRRLAESGTVHVVMWPVYGASGVPTIPTSFHKVAWGYFGIRHWWIIND